MMKRLTKSSSLPVDRGAETVDSGQWDLLLLQLPPHEEALVRVPLV